MVEGGMKCVKFLLFGFNLIFVIVAIALIASGAYVQVEFKDYFALIGGKFNSAAALLIAVGVIIFFIAVFGCFGAIKENRVCVLIFAVLLGFIFILEIAAGIAGFVYRNQVRDVVDELMNENLKKEGLDVWNPVQKEFKCCGVHGPQDWTNKSLPVPDSCCSQPSSGASNSTCPDKFLYKEGCLEAFSTWVAGKVYIIGAVGIALAFVQIVGVLFACCLARAIKKEYEVV